jgi:DNA-binding transcriptional MerR regulator
MSEHVKKNIANILKKPPRTIEFWTSSGLVLPEIVPSQGKGKSRVYSDRNLIQFGMVDLMSQMGVSLDIIRNILTVLRMGEWTPEPFPWEFRGVEGEDGKKAIEEWKKTNKIHFYDFWGDDAWGKTKELVFVLEKGMYPLGRDVQTRECFYVLEAKGPLRFTLDKVAERRLFSANSVQTIIWLGKIKNDAAQLVLG